MSETKEKNQKANDSKQERKQVQERSLFGMLKYKTDEDFEGFISNLNQSQAIIALIANARYSIAKGGLSPEEAETLSKSMRLLQAPQKPQQKAEVESGDSKKEDSESKKS